MSDTHDTDAEGKRSAIATREWIDAEGTKVPAGSPDAVGFRYTYKATGNSVDYIIGEAGKLSTMFGIMGGLTKVGNIVNSIVNADDYDGSSDPMPEVQEWLSAAEQGKWRELAEGGGARGPKYDKDVLAAALFEVLGAAAKGSVADYRERLDDKGYYAKVRNQPAVMALYYQKKGAEAPTADALA